MSMAEGNTRDEDTEAAQELLAFQIMDYEARQKLLSEPSD